MKQLFTAILFTLLFLQLYAQKPGTLDYSFGDSGKVVSKTYRNSPDASLLQPDGKIITAGSAGGYYRGDKFLTGVLLARYNKDGKFDYSFGDSGRSVNDFGEQSAKTVYALALQKDGKILAAVKGFKNSYNKNMIVVVRLNEDGSVDNHFGLSGQAVLPNPYPGDDYYGVDMALLADGRIVVAANYTYEEDRSSRPFLTCFTAEGFIDNNFGSKGTVIISDPGNPKAVSSIAITKEAKIIIGGNYSVGTYKTLLYRYNNNGTRDIAFGKSGIAEMPFERRITTPTILDIAIAADNSIFAVGYAAPNNGVYYSFLASRFLENGTPDSSFGTYGYNITNYTKENSAFNAVAVQTNGKLIAAGGSLLKQTSAFTTIRYDSDGLIDSTFGENGTIRTAFASEELLTSSATSVLIQPDGKVVLCGPGSTSSFDNYTTLVRYHGDDITRRQQIVTRIKRWLQHQGITWQTDNAVRYYNVQRSTDGGITYRQVAKLYNSRQAFITYEDEAVAGSSGALYRVAAQGKDGTRSYSNTVPVGNETQVTVFPNPVRNSMQVQGLPATGNTRISISDFVGNVRTSAIATGSTCPVNTAGLKPGTYLLKAQNGNIATTQTFVKE